MSSEEIEQSLRTAVDDYVNGRLNNLRDDIARLQSQFNEAFTRLSERLESELAADNSVAVTIAEHVRAAHNSGIEAAATESSRAKASSDLAILKAAVDEIDEQRSQADILNALVNRAAAFAPRVAFFVIKQERVTGWRARGLAGTVGDDAVREISLPLAADTLLSDVARTHESWSGAPGTHADDHQIFGRFSDTPPQRIVAIPLVARDKVVAVLYADCAEMDGEAISLEALETLVRVSGMAVELLAAKRATPDTRDARASSPAQTTSTAVTDNDASRRGRASLQKLSLTNHPPHPQVMTRRRKPLRKPTTRRRFRSLSRKTSLRRPTTPRCTTPCTTPRPNPAA